MIIIIIIIMMMIIIMIIIKYKRLLHKLIWPSHVPPKVYPECTQVLVSWIVYN